MLKFQVSFGILCLAAFAGTSHGAPQGCPDGGCPGYHYYGQLGPRSTRYSRGLRGAEILNREIFTRGVDNTDPCYQYARRSARSHADSSTLSSFESILQDLGSSQEKQRRQLYEQDEAFPKMMYKQIPSRHSSKLYVLEQPLEGTDYTSDARRVHSTLSSNHRRRSLSEDEMEEIVRQVIAELQNKQRDSQSEQSRRRGPRQPFSAASLVQRPQIKYNPYNLSPSTMMSHDVFEPRYETTQFELLSNPLDGSFHVEGDVAVSMGNDDASSREQARDTSLISDATAGAFLPRKLNVFDDDVEVLSGAEQIGDDERDDAEEEAIAEEIAVLSPTSLDTSSSNGETKIASIGREEDAEIDSYLVDDVEKPADSGEQHTPETSTTPMA